MLRNKTIRGAFFLILLSASLVINGGCSPSKLDSFVWEDPAFDLVWPTPPDRPRVQYLRSFTGPKDFKKEGQSEKAWRWLFGEYSADLPLLTPFAVASGNGFVWVADSGARMLYRFDLARQKVSFFRQFDDHLLTLPSGLAIDAPRNRIFLADAGADAVLVLDTNGTLLAKWRPSIGFQRPGGLTVAPNGDLYACDALAGVVYVFDPEGTVIATYRSQVNENGRFARPLSVGLGPAGEVVVLDALAFRIEILNKDGSLLREFGEVGNTAGRFARPKGLAVNALGHVFVSDSAFDNIQVFDLAGNLLMYWGQAGSRPGDFSLPAGLFVDVQDRLYVADSFNHRVQVFQLLTQSPSLQ